MNVVGTNIYKFMFLEQKCWKRHSKTSSGYMLDKFGLAALSLSVCHDKLVVRYKNVVSAASWPEGAAPRFPSSIVNCINRGNKPKIYINQRNVMNDNGNVGEPFFRIQKETQA